MEALLVMGLMMAGAVAGTGLLGGAAFLVFRAAQRSTEETNRIWAAVAHRNGWSFDPGQRSFLSARSRGIDAEVRSACVHVDTYTVQHQKSSTTYTRVRAQIVMPFGPAFRVHPEGFLSPIGKALGFQDIELGDPPFDDTFVVKGDHEDAVRALWTEEARRRVCDLHTKASLRSDGRTVRMSWVGVERDPETIESAVALVAELARHGVGVLERLLTVPGARWVEPSGSFGERTAPAVQLEIPGGPVHVFPGVLEDRLALCATAEGSRSIPPYRVRIGEGGAVEGPLPEGALAGDARPLLPSAAGSTVSWDGRRAYVCFGPWDEADRVVARARLVGELARGGLRQGAFR